MTKPMYKTHKVCTFSDYVTLVVSQCDSDWVLFRGQPLDKPLLPKLARLVIRDKPIEEAEQNMLEEFQRLCIPYVDRMHTNPWDWLALAQHHGMATRLLDWTSNPLAALWFAVRDATHDDTDAVIWAFVPPENDIVSAGASSDGPFVGNRTKVFRPNSITNRIVAQGGWFTVHKYIKAKRQFIPLERNYIYSKCLKKSQCLESVIQK